MNAKLMRKVIPVIAILFLTSVCCADTFEKIGSGETFNGFATQKVKQGRTFVYSDDESKFNAIYIDQWRVTYNSLGRRNSVAVINLDDQEVLLSRVISDSAAEAIIDSSNKGPIAILLEIDLPGGRGEYAKTLSDAIRQTTNCPVIAFIYGGDDGGAYSAAAQVAIACDKIYISSRAVIGSEAPMRDSGGYYGQDFPAMFNSRDLAAYKGYIATLAETNDRPEIMAMAMIDSQIDVIEVAGKDGKKSFMDRQDRSPSQTVLRAWSGKKIYATVTGDDVKEMSITLQPKDAVYAKMADMVVDSRQDILNELGASDAKLLQKSSKIEKNVNKFIATRRNLSSIVASIYYLEDRVDYFTEQIDNSQRESTLTSERVINDGYVPRVKQSFNERRGGVDQDRYESPNQRARRRGRTRSEVVIETTPRVGINQLLNDLSYVLNDLTREYNRAIVLGRRFPGAFPPGLTVSILEKQLYSANALYDDVAYRR